MLIHKIKQVQLSNSKHPVNIAQKVLTIEINLTELRLNSADKFAMFTKWKETHTNTN